MKRVVKEYKITFNIEVPCELPSGIKYELLDAVQDELSKSMSGIKYELLDAVQDELSKSMSRIKYELLDAVQNELSKSMSRIPVDIDEIYVTCESLSEVQENEEI